VLRYVISFVYVVATFPFVKNWEKELPFKLEGWDQLSQSENGFSTDFWRIRCMIRITLRGASQAHRVDVDAMCRRFIERTTRYFYPATFPILGFARDPRTQWTYASNTLQGSSNIRIVWEIFTLLKRLSFLTVVERVEIVADSDEADIAYSRSTMNRARV
jgi:hypothetical protein